MTTIRKQYHDIGSKLHSAVFTVGAIKDALDALNCRQEDQNLQRDLIRNCGAVEDSLMELEKQINVIKCWAYRIASPETSIEELNEGIHRQNTTIKLLFIEDDESICDVQAAAYERKGFIVNKAFNKADALQKIQDFIPDIAIIDLYLQNGKEGLDILKFIKTSYPNIKTIVVTYEDQASELQSVKDLQPDELLQKPVRSQAMDAKINGLIKFL